MKLLQPKLREVESIIKLPVKIRVPATGGSFVP